MTKTASQIDRMTDEQIGDTLNGTDAGDWHTIQAHRDGVEITYGSFAEARRAEDVIKAIFWDSDVAIEGSMVVLTTKQDA